MVIIPSQGNVIILQSMAGAGKEEDYVAAPLQPALPPRGRLHHYSRPGRLGKDSSCIPAYAPSLPVLWTLLERHSPGQSHQPRVILDKQKGLGKGICKCLPAVIMH